jgi:hypothetical protein
VPKKSNTRHSEVGKEAARTRNVHAAGRKTAKTRLVRWVESDKRLDDLGHGVQFLHDELQCEHVVAFLEGFQWSRRRGSPATVRLLSICPTSITADHWSEIIQSTREAVLVFLSNEGNLMCSFRHGPIRIIING